MNTRKGMIVALLILVVLVVIGALNAPIPLVEAGAPLQIEVKSAPTVAATGTPETLYIDLAWGQKMYVRCSENPAAAEQPPVGEIEMVSLGAEVWRVRCDAPGTNE